MSQRRGVSIYLVWVRCLSLFVPRTIRAEWRRQWASEIWYVYRDSVPRGGRLGKEYWQGQRKVTSFCLGAIDDVRSVSESVHLPTNVPYARSAMRCLGLLAFAIAASGACFLLLPGERAAFQHSPYRDTASIVLISREAFAESARPSISVEQYNAWRHRSQQLFSEFALYQPAVRQLYLDTHSSRSLTVASVTPNFFALLGVSVFVPQNRAHTPAVLLSSAIWHSEFDDDPELVGRTVRVDNREARIAGIVDASLWNLPGKSDAWLIESDAAASALAPASTAFVVARRATTEPLGSRWHMSIEDRPGEPAFDSAGYTCVSLDSMTSNPFAIFMMTVFLAFLALPATTSLPLGEYRVNAPHRSFRSRMRRWSFLYAKIALTLPIVFFISRDLAHLSTDAHSVHAQYIQIVASFCICLYGLRWALRDQRSRCPVCLCKLSHPARVGEASRNFLAWHGTELMCADGHGLLHVPELPTCWFSTQRWIYLDPSWSGLFAKPT
jgi:MacB-like periplasmic core domain